jgi:hypothetical protein
MKKTALAVRIAAFLLFSMLVAFQNVRLSEANPAPSEPSHIYIWCPQDGATYTTQNLSLNFTCTNALDWFGRADTDWYIGSPVFTYSLDGKDNVTITGTTTLPVTSSTTLPELSYGLHNITVYGLFTTIGHVAPDPDSALDPNSPHVTVTHSSRTVFSVEPSQSPTPSPSPSPTPSPSPSPTASHSPTPSSSPSDAPEHSLSIDPNFSLYTGLTLLIIAVATVAGLLVYFKKRKH